MFRSFFLFHSSGRLRALMLLLVISVASMAQNLPEREQWLQDNGFGMFIHWSFDSQLGIVISHSVVGASEAYTDRYFHQLPATFNPVAFDPERIAYLAKMAGMKYMVFTAKHHSGYCMWDTRTTGFNIMGTSYGKDVVRAYVKACRAHGLAVGLYFSPEDFHFLHSEGQAIRRTRIREIPEEVKERYLHYLKEQCRELLTGYGPIDIMFFDGGENFLIEDLKPYCWQLRPDLLITRGEIETPEQHLREHPSERVWEACMTMGTQWQFKPTNEHYKSGGEIIRYLVETRAKGGSLLMNVGPDAFGTLPHEQERILTEIAAWNFINGECLQEVRPWKVTNDGPVWYTWRPGKKILYAVLFGHEEWERGQRREILLPSVRSTGHTRISVLGQSGTLVEYQPETEADTRFEQTGRGLKVSLVRAQRIYNDHRWPHPLVLRLEHIH